MCQIDIVIGEKNERNVVVVDVIAIVVVVDDVCIIINIIFLYFPAKLENIKINIKTTTTSRNKKK